MKTARLQSLDIVRGLTVAGMILVNNGYGGSFPMLQHASWNGLSVSDFVFPFFLYIMGVSLYLSLGKRGFKFTGQTFGKIVKRSVILLLIGVAINWFDMAIWGDGLSIWELRFWAVLQRIALCYFLVALFSLCGRPGLTLPLSVLLLVIYTVILVLGNGYSEVSSDNILYRVDESLFGDAHLYHKSAVDPEGLLSTISALVNTLLGFYCAKLFSREKELSDKIVSVFTLGSLLIVCGFLLNFFHPYNKHIWSPSFALVTSGSCALLLALTMKFVDKDHYDGVFSRIFKVFGSNALLLYVSSELMAIIFGRIGLSEFFYNTISSIIPMKEFVSLCYALLYVAMNFLIGYPLWKKRVYVIL